MTLINIYEHTRLRQIPYAVLWLKKNKKTVFKLLSPRGYNPNKLIVPISNHAEELEITGVHCFTFNAVESTEAWRTKAMGRLT